MIKSALTDGIIESPIYSSRSSQSITSLSKIYKGVTNVYYDSTIGHLQTNELEGIDNYYDKEYQIFDSSEEDDILYKVIDGKKIFRQQHQVDTLLSKIDIKPGMRILDYGCAKGTVLKRLQAKKPEVIPYLFDVSEMYVHLWEKFSRPDRYASYLPKKEWKELFDVVTSFFAFEHTPDPLKELGSIKELLRPGGLVYMIVPNVFENIGDFIVADHIHHYSEVSISYMFAKAGFEIMEIDSSSHFAAYIVLARKSDERRPIQADLENLKNIEKDVQKMAEYWRGIQFRINDFENGVKNKRAAIYGAGVYGAFIASTINNFNQIDLFIDQNPLLQGSTIKGRPVIMPADIPGEIEVIYVGLNPKTSKSSIESLDWKRNKYSFFYL